MKIVNLSEQNSVISNYLSELRDITVQKDALRFRRNLERCGELMAYEISKTLHYSSQEVTTPLGIATCKVISDELVLTTLLRAGLPYHQGFLNVFDKAQSAFIAAYRKYAKSNKFTIQLEYATSPSIDGKVLIIVDPMIATGSSMAVTYEKLIQYGTPSKIHLASIVGVREGIDALSKRFPHKNTTLWIGAIDEELTNKSMIVPGIGDAGDLAYGSKNQ
ncbi:MAG: uracil phosphoribosyltransferase [Bacteroidales bacterium]|nr:uracil phosphoribosyltransferase [Bacteroidales bacterium]